MASRGVSLAALCPACGKRGHTVDTCFRIHKCQICGKHGHLTSTCYQNPEYKSQQVFSQNRSLSSTGLSPECQICSKKGHTGAKCFYRTVVPADHPSLFIPTCQICGLKGHTAAKCFYRTVVLVDHPSLIIPTCQICGLKGHVALNCTHRTTFAYQVSESPTSLTALNAHSAGSYNGNHTQSQGGYYMSNAGFPGGFHPNNGASTSPWNNEEWLSDSQRMPVPGVVVHLSQLPTKLMGDHISAAYVDSSHDSNVGVQSDDSNAANNGQNSEEYGQLSKEEAEEDARKTESIAFVAAEQNFDKEPYGDRSSAVQVHARESSRLMLEVLKRGTKAKEDDEKSIPPLKSIFGISGGRKFFIDAEEAEEFFKPLRENEKSYTKICLSNRSFGLDAAYVVVPILSSIKCQLKEVDFIAGRSVTEAIEVMNMFSSALEGGVLRYLNLSDNAMGEKGVNAFESLLRSQNSLEELYLMNGGISEEAASAISKFIPSTEKLRVLYFPYNMRGDVGAIVISDMLKRSPILEGCHCFSMRVGCEGGVALADALGTCTHLKKLNLSDNMFGIESGVALSKFLYAFTDLTEMYLSYFNLEDEGTEALVNALKDYAPLHEVLKIAGNVDCSNALNALQFGGSIDDISDSVESKTFSATGKSEWDQAKIEEIEALQKQGTVFSTSLDSAMATSIVLIAMSFLVTKGVIGVCTYCPFESKGTKDWSNHGDLTIGSLFEFVVSNLVLAAVIVKDQDSHHWEKEIKLAEAELQRLKSKLDTTSALLLDSKADLGAYMESRSKEESDGGELAPISAVPDHYASSPKLASRNVTESEPLVDQAKAGAISCLSNDFNSADNGEENNRENDGDIDGLSSDVDDVNVNSNVAAMSNAVAGNADILTKECEKKLQEGVGHVLLPASSCCMN